MSAWLKALAAILAKAKGDTRPHKYIARHPRGAGGYWYEYEHETGERMVHHRDGDHLPIRAERRLGDVHELLGSSAGANAWTHETSMPSMRTMSRHEAEQRAAHYAQSDVRPVSVEVIGAEIAKHVPSIDAWKEYAHKGAAPVHVEPVAKLRLHELKLDAPQCLRLCGVPDQAQGIISIHYHDALWVDGLAKGKVFITRKLGTAGHRELVITNVSTERPGDVVVPFGMGAQNLLTQAIEARRVVGEGKFDRVVIRTTAMGNPHERAIGKGNGYLTWLLLGFRSSDKITGPHGEPIEQLAHSPDGRAYWMLHGGEFEATFDPQDPYCLATLSSELARKSSGTRAKGLMKASPRITFSAISRSESPSRHEQRARISSSEMTTAFSQPGSVHFPSLTSMTPPSTPQPTGSAVESQGRGMYALLKAAHTGRAAARLFALYMRRGETSPLLPPPSPNRKAYPFVASLVYRGIPIDIEQRKGDTREGVDQDGKPWKVTMRAHYGEVRSHVRGASGVMGARGMDGDRLDVYVGDDPDSDVVVVVDQRIPETGEHDEQKVMLGFPSVEAALECYRGQYTKPGFYGGHTVMAVDEFRRKIADPASAGQPLAKALANVEWVPLSPLLGELAFASALAKGESRHRTPDGAEVIAWHVLTKAGTRAVKYIKRWRVGDRWRYAYARTNAAGKRTVAEHHADTAHMGLGSSWQLHDGHYEVTADHGAEVTIKGPGGKTERVSKDELRRRVLDHHREAIEAHREQKRQEIEDVRRYGSEAQKKRAGLVTETAPRPARGDLQAVGDHIWGSRKDLANLGRIESSKQLEGMSYADAAAVVTKAKLVTPLDLDDARTLGMEPAVAHLFMHMLSTVRAKPDDTTASRAAFVDEIREVQGAMRNVKTVEDFTAMREGMVNKWKASRAWSRSPHAVGKEYSYPPPREAYDEAKRLSEETGVEHRVSGSYGTYRSWIEAAQQKPYDSLGKRFVNTLLGSSPGARQDFRDAVRRARELDAMGVDAAWETLKTGTAPATKPPKEKPPKPESNTERGHSTAKDRSSEVERVGGREVKDANPTRVKETFNLREVDFGQSSYMTQADREHHVQHLEGALHDLVDALGLPPTAASFNGRLGVALGARGRGKAAAHYEPGRAVINITKFAGGGALAHEWGHALDNLIAGHCQDHHPLGCSGASRALLVWAHARRRALQRRPRGATHQEAPQCDRGLRRSRLVFGR